MPVDSAPNWGGHFEAAEQVILLLVAACYALTLLTINKGKRGHS